MNVVELQFGAAKDPRGNNLPDSKARHFANAGLFANCKRQLISAQFLTANENLLVHPHLNRYCSVGSLRLRTTNSNSVGAVSSRARCGVLTVRGGSALASAEPSSPAASNAGKVTLRKRILKTSR